MSSAKKIMCLLLVLAMCFAMGGCKTKKKKVVVIKRPSNNVSDNVSSDDSNDDIVQDAYISDRELADKEGVYQEVIAPEYIVSAVAFKLTNDYTIIYPKGNEQLRQAAEKLSSYFSKNGIKIGVSDDAETAKGKEILLGDTNRKKSALAENKYAVTVAGEKVFFESGNFNGVVKAVSWFIAQPYKADQFNTLTGTYTFSSTVKRPSGTYTFVWGDEFDGNALDASKWEFSSSITAESSFKLSRDSKAVNVSEGLLKLTALREFDPDNNQVQAVAPYTVESKKHLNFQYGYLEMRARIPFGAGAWPSLWLSGACGTNSGAVVSNLFNNGDIYPANFSAEFDIVEYTKLQPNFHKWFYDDAPIAGVEGIEQNTKHSSLGAVTKLPSSDLYLDVNQSYVYQTIAFDWTPTDITIYINGNEHFRYNWKESEQLDGFNDMTDFLNPVFIRLNNHLIPGDIPSDFSTLPIEYYIDYVRLYQKSGTGGIWLAD